MRKLSLYLLILSVWIIACNSEENKESINIVSNENDQVNVSNKADINNYIDRKTAKKMFKKFDTTLYEASRNSKSVWFKKDDIEVLYNALQTISNADGARIYFSMYDKNDQNNKDRLTVFIVPTVYGGMYNNVVYHRDTFALKNNKAVTNINHGELCPNHCDTTMIFN